MSIYSFSTATETRPLSKGKNTHTAACDLIRGNKSTALFPHFKSQAAGRHAPSRSAPLYVCFYPKAALVSGLQMKQSHTL
jgi:hypothetical protein